MKIQLNEIKRMQQLAGLITESQLNENNFFGFSYKNKNKDVDTKKLMAMDEKEAFQIARKWMEKNNLDPNEIQSMKQLDQYEIEKYVEITESQLNEKMSYDDFEQMIKPFIDLAKSKGWIWNSSGDSWFEVGSPAIALYHSTELPTTADGEYKGQKMLASKDVTIGNQVQTYRGDIEKKQGDVIMQSDYNMDQAYFQSKDKAILDAIKSSMANVTDVVEDTKESSSQLTTSKSFEPVKYYYMVLRKKQAQQAESIEQAVNEALKAYRKKK